MKPKTLIGLTLLVGFTALLFLSFGQQVGGYMNFEEAESASVKVHVVGDWVRDMPVNYDQGQNLFTFHMRDEDGNVRQVRYANPKPTNFEDAEQLVVEGRAEDGVFTADHILVKCPSKYNDTRGLEAAQAASD